MNLPDPDIDPRRYCAIDVHGKYHDEHIAFSRARSYISNAGTLARQGVAPIAQDHIEFAEKIYPRYRSPEDYLIAQLFIAHISAFELFLQEMITVIIRNYPHKIGSVQFKLSEILQTDDLEDLVFRAAEETLNKLTYRKPSEYLKEVCDIFSVDPSLIANDWLVFIEAKARRDLGVHNGWICNQTYIRKMTESQIDCTLAVGDLSIPTDFQYLQNVSAILYKISNTLYREAMDKLKV